MRPRDIGDIWQEAYDEAIDDGCEPDEAGRLAEAATANHYAGLADHYHDSQKEMCL